MAALVTGWYKPTAERALSLLLQSSPYCYSPASDNRETYEQFFVTKLWQESINKFVKGKTILWTTLGAPLRTWVRREKTL